MSESLNRRKILARATVGLAALTSACKRPTPPSEADTAPSPPEPAPPSPLLEGHDLTPARIDQSLEIRSITGLRPFRPSGFVVRREEREGKILVHNYGHGGGGMTLSWGTSHLAIGQAGSVAGVSCAVIGGGVMGLSTARLLQLRGARVTLYAKALPPETTSNIAGAQWWPVSVYDNSRRTPDFGNQFIAAARFSYRYYQNLVGPRWGVRWIPNYYLSSGPPGNGWLEGPGGVLHDLQVAFRDFGPGEHLFPGNYARRFHTMLIEPATYLNTLLHDIQNAGASIEVREFATPDEFLRLPHPVFFNCSGLGSRQLFGDEELMPVKGQLSVLLPQPEVDYNLISGRSYMFPRSDGLILGGSFERGQWNVDPDPAVRSRILAEHAALADGFARAQASGSTVL